MKKKLCLLLVAALLPMLLVVPACAEELDCSAMDTAYSVSYTHLTLPTICSV